MARILKASISMEIVPLLVCFLPFSTSFKVPAVKLQNAANQDMTMPAVGLGTGAYVYMPNTVPE